MVKKIILIVFSLLFLSGCVKGDVNIKYTNLEKANLIIELLCQKEILSTYDTTLEDIQNKLAVNQLKNWQIKELNESINGVSYVGFALNAPDNINNMLLNYISYDQENNTYQVLFPKDLIDSLLNSSELQDINNSSLLSLENMGLEINLKISLPGKITETNYGNINNNEVKINLLDFITQKQTTEIKITSSKQNFDSRLINILLIIILVTSLYFLLRKKH
ncbi:hypothetical protein B5E92_06110 [Erysipelatoclostridium sp. An15]|uniref:Lipoprotein n=2 Tax=Erysipelotrichales TaxID=526525 RepID=A0A9D1XJF1_9FIRM|nr:MULTISPECIES: hypothetical protein [unclassified Thomasclavelia]OUP76982.1 hypothetical protein B5F09_07285 [Erysipelatoclostridium sp. An173]OUQ07910.1 hypothetical protein B5E92_06110 [Erysipelatoclostridium sp. An15]HIX80559.1 hypothetical protein [Candidatus Erysipelatoclostridium merdavium]